MTQKKSALRWDEDGIQAHAEESLLANRMKIDEAKTPFHYLEDDGETSSAAVHSHGASQAPPGSQLQAGIDLAALSASALERRDAPMYEEDPEDQERKFKELRSAHYKTGGLAALRAQAQAALDEADDDEQDDTAPAPA
mmetsp:Transcript_23098/g.38215  ORF Transcript_23098/g.38215 Transcript_23098/m.38215 type:complete len:139 (+) Transcript_23098:105-521(+)